MRFFRARPRGGGVSQRNLREPPCSWPRELQISLLEQQWSWMAGIRFDNQDALLGSIPATNRRVPRIPDFLCSFVGSLNFMRLSLKKGAHAVLSRAEYRKFGASRSFFARCGIPRASPSSPPGLTP